MTIVRFTLMVTAGDNINGTPLFITAVRDELFVSAQDTFGADIKEAYQFSSPVLASNYAQLLLEREDVYTSCAVNISHGIKIKLI